MKIVTTFGIKVIAWRFVDALFRMLLDQDHNLLPGTVERIPSVKGETLEVVKDEVEQPDLISWQTLFLTDGRQIRYDPQQIFLLQTEMERKKVKRLLRHGLAHLLGQPVPVDTLLRFTYLLITEEEEEVYMKTATYISRPGYLEGAAAYQPFFQSSLEIVDLKRLIRVTGEFNQYEPLEYTKTKIVV